MKRLKERDDERRLTNFTRVRTRVYEVPRFKLLSDVNLERGDTLPVTGDESDGGDWEIIESDLSAVKGQNTQLATVRAIKYDVE